MERKTYLKLGVLVCLALVLVLMPLVAACAKPAPPPAPAPAPPPPKPIKLVVQTYLPPGEKTAEVLKKWSEDLEKRTGGRIISEYSAGSALGTAVEQYEVVRSGRSDVTMFYPAYTPGLFPLIEVVMLPVRGPDKGPQELYSQVLYKLYKKGYLDKELKDVKPLFFNMMNPYHFYMAKDLIRTFDDIKGKKIRVSGVHTEIVKALGGVPVFLPYGEVYGATERGVIDAHMGHWTVIIAFALAPVTKHVYEISVGGFPFVIAMNSATWDRLPADIKAIIDKMSTEYSAIYGRMYDEQLEAGKQIVVKAGGQIHIPSKADKEKIAKAVTPIWEWWIGEMQAKGHPARQIVNDFYNISRDLGMDEPFYGYKP